jgi:hypothetical protein
VVAGARPEDAAWLAELAGVPVQLTVPRYRMWEGRGCRSGFDLLTAGLSHLDLFWKEYLWNANIVENPDKVIEQLQDASAQIEGGRELVFPGALVQARVGRGRLILDQRRWTTTNGKLLRVASRNLSALALGLGVAIAPPAPRTPSHPPPCRRLSARVCRRIGRTATSLGRPALAFTSIRVSKSRMRNLKPASRTSSTLCGSSSS